MTDAWAALLRSRKFWLAVVAAAQAIVLHYFAVPDAIWQAIMVVIAVVIAGITVEDAALKVAPMMYAEAHAVDLSDCAEDVEP